MNLKLTAQTLNRRISIWPRTLQGASSSSKVEAILLLTQEKIC